MKKIALIISLLILILVSTTWFFRGLIKDWWWERNQPELPQATVIDIKENEEVNQVEEETITETESNTNQEQPTPPQPSQEEKSTILAEVNLAVPFTSQAPLGLWDEFEEDMCEEASLLMVNRYHQKRSFTSKEETRAALEEIQRWEIEKFGIWKSTTAEQVATIAREMLDYKNTEVVKLTSFDQIKEKVSQGYPVILPAAGRELKNPNFKQPGPLYHMLVVRGWLSDGRVITNDPGTRHGEGYIYAQNVLWEALANWDGVEGITEEKLMIVVK